MEKVHTKYIILSFVAAVIIYLLPFGLKGDAHRMLFVMVFVVMLWITEAVPLHYTAIFSAFLLITLVGLQPTNVFAQYFDPVIMLLLGGFVIAVAMSKYRLDEYIAYNVIERAGNNSEIIILSLISTSAFISMWISNSATAAIIMPIALVILAKNRIKPGTSKFGKAAVLAVAYGATIGGIGTIIGSTPNILAAKFLHDSGASISFYDWFYRGFPFMSILVLLGWVVLITVFKPEKKHIITVKGTGKITSKQKEVLIVFMITVFLWITENIHGIASSVIALVPIILFFFTGMLKTEDFFRVDWPTLILVGGGIALGMGIHTTSLDTSLASILSGIASGHNVFVLFLIIGVLGIIMTSVISNTTAAVVYLPIVVALASSFGANITNITIVASMGVSL